MRYPCPIPDFDMDDDGQPRYWIDVPEAWLGHHADRYIQALESCDKHDPPQRGVIRDLTCAMALLEDWHLPGIGANPEKWDFGQVRLEVIAWINKTVLRDGYYKAFEVPKKNYSRSSNGSTMTAAVTGHGNGENST